MSSPSIPCSGSDWLVQQLTPHPLHPTSLHFNWNSDCAVVAAPATVAAEVAEGQRLFHSAADWNSHYFPNFQSLHKPELDQCLKRSRINNNATEISGLLSNNISSSRIN